MLKTKNIRFQFFILSTLLIRMETSRRRHACTKVTLNGRPGLVVSGGVSTSSKNLTSVEFYDSASGQWASLPDLQRGRRSHAMLVHNGRLTVTGGVQADGRLLRDSEEFDGKRWIDSRSNLREPRQGFSLIKVLNLLFSKTFYHFQGASLQILQASQTSFSPPEQQENIQ